MGLDDNLRSYFDGQFERVHTRITKNEVSLASLSRELKDLKSNGYFVRPGRCDQLHNESRKQVAGIEKRIAYYMGAAAAVAVIMPFIFKYVFHVT